MGFFGTMKEIWILTKCFGVTSLNKAIDEFDNCFI